jgi:rsbT co-antagonist protein RsbR
MGPHWAGIRDLLTRSPRRAPSRASPLGDGDLRLFLQETALAPSEQEFGQDGEGLFRETWSASLLLDELGIYTTDVYQKSGERHHRQQREMMELSTP